MATVWLFAYGSGQPVAFSNDGEKTWSTSSGEPWAWSTDNGWLWSYATGEAIGWFSGSSVFDPQGQPLYFKPG
ncbi:MAG TPA: hypothetical protein VNF73_10915 [Candidatus Saccharimonadales bacterium]|nr:hypothetical protein [Candidatus Saccharimonadales bacterium]